MLQFVSRGQDALFSFSRVPPAGGQLARGYASGQRGGDDVHCRGVTIDRRRSRKPRAVRAARGGGHGRMVTVNWDSKQV